MSSPFDEEIVASAWSSDAAAFATNDGEWWFKAIGEPSSNISSLKVRGPLSSVAEQSVGVFRPLGRNTPIVVSGDIYGLDGEYAIMFTNDADWESAQNLLFAFTGDVCVQDPFDGQKTIRIVSRKVDETGTAGNLIRTVIIGYVEVG